MSRRFDTLLDINLRMLEVIGKWQMMTDQGKDDVLPNIEWDYAVGVLDWRVKVIHSGHRQYDEWTAPGRPSFVGTPPQWTRDVNAAVHLMMSQTKDQDFWLSCAEGGWRCQYGPAGPELSTNSRVCPTPALAVFSALVRKQVENYEDI